MMKEKGFAHMSEGALVVDVKEDTDTKEIPPCIILKSDGASLYSTTDLATLVMRMKENNPDRVIYLADARQSMHFIQVFRCARKTGIVPDTTELVHIGFGTMNGKDGKPFKTRDGGVMRLEYLLKEIDDEMLNKIKENQKEKENLNIDEAEAEQTAKTVALAAVKYGDLSNQASKDYIFDIDRFTSFEGNTGPYILYTIVRIKSILSKYEAKGGDISALKDAIMPQSMQDRRISCSLWQSSMLQLRVHTRSLHHTRYVHTSTSLPTHSTASTMTQRFFLRRMKSLRSHIFRCLCSQRRYLRLVSICLDSQLLTGCKNNNFHVLKQLDM